MQKLIQKADLKRIKISDIQLDLPDLKNIKETKSIAIGKWIINWIKDDLKAVNSLLPSKAEFAYALGVSIGTIQNALRYVEDLGYVESKQCIWTIIRDYKKKSSTLRKLTSKREIAIEEIKKYILKNEIKPNAQLPSSRKLAQAIGCSANTTRLALEYLCFEGHIKHKYKSSKETGWILKNTDFIIDETNTNETLVSKIQKDLRKYISDNLKVGDRIPPHSVLVKELNVSIKTVHDALQALVDDGILLCRRGRYGTTVIKMPDEISGNQEMSIFAPAQDAAFYYYEKTQNTLKKMIAENYEIGSKLPSISELSQQMDLSPNTIRKAFHNLAKEGYLAFSRGRYGGTFVIDLPDVEQGFKWLAVNPKYAELYK